MPARHLDAEMHIRQPRGRAPARFAVKEANLYQERLVNLVERMRPQQARSSSSKP
jgi:hypothetical protein